MADRHIAFAAGQEELKDMAEKPNPDGYVHSRDDKEYQRLRDQAAMWRPATEAVLNRIGLKSGMSCLDIGCGPGAVMRLMADRVGPNGCVTGIDIDGSLGRLALSELRSEGGSQFEFVEGDALKLDSIPGETFDLSFCRLVLMHLTDPVALIEKMHHWTKQGGYVAAQEFDFGGWQSNRCVPL